MRPEPRLVERNLEKRGLLKWAGIFSLKGSCGSVGNLVFVVTGGLGCAHTQSITDVRALRIGYSGAVKDCLRSVGTKNCKWFSSKRGAT